MKKLFLEFFIEKKVDVISTMETDIY